MGGRRREEEEEAVLGLGKFGACVEETLGFVRSSRGLNSVSALEALKGREEENERTQLKGNYGKEPSDQRHVSRGCLL